MCARADEKGNQLKVTVLGIDGLSFDIVEEMDLKNIKQAEYGKLFIPDECCWELVKGGKSPWTPLCWMSILTGDVPPEQYRINRHLMYDNRFIEFIRWNVGKYFKFIRGKRRFLREIGFKPSSEIKNISSNPLSRNLVTFFGLAEKKIDFNVPTYSEVFRLGPKIKTNNRLKLLPYSDKEFDLMKRYTRSVLRGRADYDLFMAYTRVLDSYGHQMYRTKVYYHRYELMDLFIRDIARDIEGLLLIVSDHGIRQLKGTKLGGEHSDHAFYSTNMSLDISMNSITDVYDLVKRTLET